MYIFFQGRLFFGLAFTILATVNVFAQKDPLFKKMAELDRLGIRFYEILCTKEGSVRLTSSIGMWQLKGHQMDGPAFVINDEITDNKTGRKSFIKNLRSYLAEDSVRAMTEGPDSIFFMLHMIICFSIRPMESQGLDGRHLFFLPRANPLIGYLPCILIIAAICSLAQMLIIFIG